MSTTETWTLGRLLTWTTEFLRKNGSSSPRLDSEVLLAHARGCQRIELYTAFDDEPAEEVKTAFREMVRRRAEGTPVAHLVGYKEFYSAAFEVNADVLIPRPETEHLVVEALDRAKQLLAGGAADSLNIVDVGTGSGIVAVTMALQLPACQVLAVDMSQSALDVARRNIEKHGLEERVELLQGDLLEQCPPEQKFDLILSNPPYVSSQEYEALESTVKDYEPKVALVAGPRGDEVISRLLTQAADRLAQGGFVIFELSPMLAQRLPDFVDSVWQEPKVTKDLAGHARVVTLSKSSNSTN